MVAVVFVPERVGEISRRLSASPRKGMLEGRAAGGGGRGSSGGIEAARAGVPGDSDEELFRC